MKLNIKILFFIVLLVSEIHIVKAQENLEKRPNVILIITDDQGYGDLACHGNTILDTPNMDRLHSQSVRFTNFHVSPTCAPTRAALMTGLYTNRTGVWHTIGGRSLLRKDKVTMAEVFKENEYHTAIFGKWHLGDNYPFRPQDRGFLEVLVHGAGGVGQTPDFFDNDYFNDTYIHNGKLEEYRGYCTDVWFREAIEYIERQKDNPFFCYISTNAPHSPFYVDNKYSKAYEGIKNIPSNEFYGMITNIDDNIGILTRKLEDLGISDNTILIFMTDNGSSMGDKKIENITAFNAGMRGKKNSEYDGGHRVPFFVKYPNGKLEAGKDVNNISAHIDVLPTLIELCGLKLNKPIDFDGKSLMPLINGSDENWSERLLITDSQRVEHPIKWRKSAVMSDNWRLVNGEELYNMVDDPGQTNDVALKEPKKVEKFQKAYDTWWDDVSLDFDDFQAIVIGSPAENPVNLTSHDWHSNTQVPWNHKHVRSGLQGNGFWVLDIEHTGIYEITLSRWPLSMKLPINSGMEKRPALNGTSVNESLEGKALNILKAKIEIGREKMEQDVKETDVSVTFTVNLKAGKDKRLITTFRGNEVDMG
ncbi:MAG: arylsulfatase, partial [Bacteroidota bacterium]|nr:arylsulfatase [Bacteroidota bacterium]